MHGHFLRLGDITGQVAQAVVQFLTFIAGRFSLLVHHPGFRGLLEHDRERGEPLWDIQIGTRHFAYLECMRHRRTVRFHALC